MTEQDLRRGTVQGPARARTGGPGGRTRDRARGEAIVDAAIEVLAEVGYDAMTMDLVAVRARAGKSTLYRRWPSKEELVLDVVARIKGETDTAALPDTHSLRGDVAALFRGDGGSGPTLAVTAGLAVMLSRHAALAEAATAAILEPWTAAHRALIRRAVDRGELTEHTDDRAGVVDLIASLAPSLVAFRLLVARRPLDLDELLALVDHVVVPALCATPTSTTPPSEETSMSVTATLHLNFSGEAREALEFYRSVFGGRLSIATYADLGAPGDSPDATSVVFGEVSADNGFRIMAYDVPTAGRSSALAGTSGDRPATRREYGTTITGERFFVSLNGDDTGEVTAQWEALATGASVIEALAPTAWAPLFGMLTDRFGVTWSIGVSAPRDAG